MATTKVSGGGGVVGWGVGGGVGWFGSDGQESDSFFDFLRVGIFFLFFLWFFFLLPVLWFAIVIVCTNL